MNKRKGKRKRDGDGENGEVQRGDLGLGWRQGGWTVKIPDVKYVYLSEINKLDFLQFLGTIFILSMLSDLECLISFLLLKAGTNGLAFYSGNYREDCSF